MWRKSIRTDYRLWAIFAAGAFVALGFWTWLPENVKGAVHYWQLWQIFLSGEYGASSSDIVFGLLLLGLIRAIPAIAIGWVAQAVIGALRTARSHPNGMIGLRS